MLCRRWNSDVHNEAYSKQHDRQLAHTDMSLGEMRSQARCRSQAMRPSYTAQISQFTFLLLCLTTAAASGVKRPNFIVILTDDQGWDDIGRNNPYVNTPNIDRWLRRSTIFDNFYVTPQCAQSRAEFLTGRSYPRTGTMQVSGGYDFIGKGEATIANVLGAAGYRTAHFGKWHNAQVLGYEPWFSGFQDGYFEYFSGVASGSTSISAESYPNSTSSVLMQHNGYYYFETEAQQGEGPYLAQDMMLKQKVIDYLQQQHLRQSVKNIERPQFIYFATRAIHVNVFGWTKDGKPIPIRYSPPAIRQKYRSHPKYQGMPNATLDAWAFLEYLDSALGELFTYLEASGQDKSTYIFLMGDNGSALLEGEDSTTTKRYRMPSGMRGGKGETWEGGIRNFLAVSGPGVQPGVVDSTLLSMRDILPTIADLAGINPANISLGPKPKPWDGISFKNLLRTPTTNASSTASSSNGTASTDDGSPPDGVDASGRRRRSVATRQQQERYIVQMGQQCWDANAVPELNKDRTVKIPQLLLDFEKGGMAGGRATVPGIMPTLPGPGIKRCLVVRWKHVKWNGMYNQVWRINTDHIESSETLLPEPEHSQLASKLSSVARDWWQSMMAEPHAFRKPMYFFGLKGRNVTNMLAAGAHERTPGAVVLFVSGAAGFKNPGDRMCFRIRVQTAGKYEVVPIYTSSTQATFKISFGNFASIKAGKAPSLISKLPALSVMKGMSMGNITLPKSGNQQTEACLELISSDNPGTFVFKNLGNIQITRHGGSAQTTLAPNAAGSAGGSSSSSSRDAPMAKLLSGKPAVGLDVSGGHSKLQVASAEAAWNKLRLSHGWPDGQRMAESLYSPYNSEGIEECSRDTTLECMPQI